MSRASLTQFDDLPKEGDRDGEFVFREAAAKRALAFFDLLVHVEGEWAGKKFALEPWQHRIVWLVFGWLAPDGLRRYRRVYVEIPRKNGKSTFAAALALKLLLADDEPGAQIYGAAENREQAGIIFRIAAGMVLSPKLQKALRSQHRRVDVLPSTKTIAVPATNSFYRAIPADDKSARGINAHGVVIDELLTQPDERLFEVLTTAQGARRQPLVFMFTTAGFDEKSLCGKQHDYARKVLSGVIKDESFLAVIFAADPNEDFALPATWQKANPLYDSSRTLQKYLAEKAVLAQNVPAFENTFRREHLNQWTKQDVRWMPMAAWDKCGGIVNRADLKGRRCVAGLDLSQVTDLTAFALVFLPLDGETEVKVLWRYWVPQEGIERRSRLDGVPYDEWAREGYITATPGNAIDYSIVERDIAADAEFFQIEEVVYDRWNSYAIIQNLEDHAIRVRPLGQGMRDLPAPTNELMRLVLGKQLNHGGNPVSRWCADNVVVEQDAAGNIKPTKRRSRERIDGISALIDALDGYMRVTSSVPRISFIA